MITNNWFTSNLNITQLTPQLTLTFQQNENDNYILIDRRLRILTLINKAKKLNKLSISKLNSNTSFPRPSHIYKDIPLKYIWMVQ